MYMCTYGQGQGCEGQDGPGGRCAEPEGLGQDHHRHQRQRFHPLVSVPLCAAPGAHRMCASRHLHDNSVALPPWLLHGTKSIHATAGKQRTVSDLVSSNARSQTLSQATHGLIPCLKQRTVSDLVSSNARSQTLSPRFDVCDRVAHVHVT
jgi:hypothetical protein